jgi:hypothetical protein
MNWFSRAIVAIGVAGLLVACGGSDSEPAIDRTKVLTKAEYIKVSDDICLEYRGRINGIISSAGNDLSLQEAKDTWNNKLIPLFEAEHKELSDLKPPPADVAEMEAALRAMKSAINTIIGRVQSASSKAALDAMSPRGLRTWKLAAGNYGMSVCGPKGATTTSQP